MRVWFTIAILGFLACSNPLPPAYETPQIADIDQDELIARLYTHFISQPKGLSDEEQNRIIEYAIEKSLPLSKSHTGLFYLIWDDQPGEKLEWGAAVRVHYKGMFLDGSEFDSSYRKGRPLATYVGEGIDGFNESLAMMSPGDKMIAVLPSALAYGATGFTDLIPPHSILYFEIALLDGQ